jgi:hypothetical protein
MKKKREEENPQKKVNSISLFKSVFVFFIQQSLPIIALYLMLKRGLPFPCI